MDIEVKVEAEIKPEPIEIEILNTDNVPQYSSTIEIGDVKLENDISHQDTDEDSLSLYSIKENPEYVVPLSTANDILRVTVEKPETNITTQVYEVKKRILKSSGPRIDCTMSDKCLPLHGFDTSPWDIDWGTTDSNDGPALEGSSVRASNPAPGSTRSSRPQRRPRKQSDVHRSDGQKHRRVTLNQLEVLWDHLRLNRSLATGRNKSTQAREYSRRMWTSAAQRLNAQGDGATKDPKGWAKIPPQELESASSSVLEMPLIIPMELTTISSSHLPLPPSPPILPPPPPDILSPPPPPIISPPPPLILPRPPSPNTISTPAFSPTPRRRLTPTLEVRQQNRRRRRNLTNLTAQDSRRAVLRVAEERVDVLRELVQEVREMKELLSDKDEVDDPTFSPLDTPLRRKKRKRSLESFGSDPDSPVSASPSRPAVGELLNYEMEPRLRATADQFAILVEFMKRHGDMSRPQQGLQGRLRADRLWKKLTDTLNSVRGGVEKAPEKWRKVWADLKAKTKKKEMVRRYASRTSGIPSTKVLSKLEEKVLFIMGLLRVEVQPQPVQPQSAGDVSPLPAEQPPASPPPAPPPPAALHAGVDCADMDREEHRVSPTPSANRDNPLTPPQSPPHVRLPSRRRLLRRPAQTAFDRRLREFVAVEIRKVKLDELRERNLHERECEKLRLESRKIDLGMEIKEVLVRLVGIAERVLDSMS